MLDPLYFSVTFSVEINTTDVTYGWNGDTVGYRVYYQHFSTEQDQMKNVCSKVKIKRVDGYREKDAAFLRAPPTLVSES